MATKSIVILFLALAAFQGINADTLLKRSPAFFDLFAPVEAFAQNFREFGGALQKQGEQALGNAKQQVKSFEDTLNGISGAFGKNLQDLGSSLIPTNAPAAKRSPGFFDIFAPLQTLAQNLGEAGSAVQNQTDQAVSSVKQQFQSLQDAGKGFSQEFGKNLQDLGSSLIPTNPPASKRSLFSADDVNNLFKNFQSGLDGIAQKVKSALAANANSTNVLDSLKNFVSNFVSGKINLKEITADISECADAEKQNVTNVHDATKAALENVLAQEEQKAAPFVKNVSVTAPKVANLVMQTYASYSSCAQTNVVCIVQVITNAMNQAKALEPEVTQEIQQGEALFQSIIADSNVIKQTIDSAFAQMKAIGEETVDCIKGKINA